ncbi:hypothetical protein C461_07864 [Halorubrum aidingense JCM 13560]|uniref:Uncharacterized protein n=1 Tax=Halorubrum aidingense JCM 13560 TaxID=1230454 RepID=M0PC77_9EURY|nr:hypothetical protein [Halorubrum aidingense]EMA67626.1 hypothetical protein C461_07864 [Halorubrum aidingense JCM 13560]
MSATTQDRPRYATATRVDVTDCPADRIDDRIRRNRVRGSEVHLERRGGRTFLVTTPAE